MGLVLPHLITVSSLVFWPELSVVLVTRESSDPVCCLYCGCDFYMTSVVLVIGVAFEVLGIGVTSGVSGISMSSG